MDRLTYQAIDQMLGSGLTNHPIDNKRAVLALRAAYDPQAPISVSHNNYMIIRDLILHKRTIHRNWVTEVQRKWQTNRRTVTPRSCDIRYHHWGKRHNGETILRAEGESVRTREGYVRCDGLNHSAHGVETFMAAL